MTGGLQFNTKYKSCQNVDREVICIFHDGCCFADFILFITCRQPILSFEYICHLFRKFFFVFFFNQVKVLDWDQNRQKTPVNFTKNQPIYCSLKNTKKKICEKNWCIQNSGLVVDMWWLRHLILFLLRISISNIFFINHFRPLRHGSTHICARLAPKSKTSRRISAMVNIFRNLY